MTNQGTNKPEHKIRYGSISATIWKNKRIVNNNVIELPSISIERSYQDKDGNWKTTNSFQPNDLMKVILACQQTLLYLYTKEENVTEEVIENAG